MIDYYDASQDDDVSYCPDCGGELDHGECECGYLSYKRSLEEDPDDKQEEE